METARHYVGDAARDFLQLFTIEKQKQIPRSKGPEFTRFFRPIVLIAAILSGLSMWYFDTFSFISSEIRDTHTRFAISQIVSALGELEEAEFPMSSGELIETLKKLSIDWNSCRVDGARILDGLGQPMEATFDRSTSTWTLHSSGKDGNFGTDDDIQGTTPRNTKAEPDP